MTNFTASVVESAFNFFKNLFASISFDIVFAIALGLMLVFVIVAWIRIHFSFEKSALRSIRKMNKYLVGAVSITEDNLVQFHHNLQKMPQKIRERWQLYILERDGLPSRYLTSEYCIRRPLSASVIKGVQKQVKYASILIAIVAAIIGFCAGYASLGDDFAAQGSEAFVVIRAMIQYALLTPLLVLLMGVVCNMIIEKVYGSVNARIYDEFEKFIRSLNKAVATMPDTIDFQVLFTQKEIDEGIPVLREYLEKQKLEEQQMLEQSKYAALAHSPYDFQELGVDGEQLITRAVDESENFLMKKIGLQNEIQEYEKKLAQSQTNMDEIEKEANRKLQTIKENIERLNKAISETTNRVEINYNNRQIRDEMEKRAAVEKDLRSLLSKEQVVMNECNVEIQKRKELIEKDKAHVESALKSEYNTFAVKVYDTLSGKLSEENEDVIRDYQNQIMAGNAKIKTLSKEVEEKDALIAEKDLLISNLKVEQIQKSQPKVVEPESQVVSQPEPDPVAPNLMEETPQQETDVVYDENGSVIDYSQYFDENGNFIGEMPEEQVVSDEEEPQTYESVEPLVVTTEQEVPEEQTSQETQVQDETKPVLELAAPAVMAPAPLTEEKKPAKKDKKPSSKKTTKPKTATKKPSTKSTKKTDTEKQKDKTKTVKTTKKDKGATIKVAEESLKSAKTPDDFNEIQKQIDQEQKKLKQNKDALQDQINKALSKMEKSSTKTSRATSIKKIKELIDQLKEKAKQAKQNGATKEEIKSINTSVAELVEALTKFSKK